MSIYDQCKECMGRHVSIRMKDGNVHRGIIDRVDKRRVYLRPLGNSRHVRPGYEFGGGYGPGEYGRPGYGRPGYGRPGYGRPGYGGPGYGFGGGYGRGRYGYGLALAGIAALSLLFLW